MIKACVFDLDGTTINTLGALRYCVSSSLAEMGLPPVTEDEIKQYISNGKRALLRRALAKYDDTDPGDMADLMEIYDRIFIRDCDRDLKVYEGMPEVLEELKSRGLKLATLTNKGEPGAQRCISKVYREGLFDIVIGARPGHELKPDTGSLLEILDGFGVKTSETLYFGDSWVDMQTGKDAGCVTVGVLWGYRDRAELEAYSPEYIIERPEQILEIVDELNGTAGKGCITDSRAERVEYVIDGEEIFCTDDFYRTFAEAMTEDGCCGHNLDAFADMLRGGFGKHLPGQPITVVWNGFTESRAMLGAQFTLRVIEIMLDKDADWDVMLKVEV